ncbi:MAG TPA: glycosyltransferase family 4 protein [Gemmatimonadales bacterium]|nr:glycosyltransferase family 4 protein [Gemmatimonadales bacterium]
MRVVFLTHNFPHWPGELSGAALGMLARALIRRGLSVRVVTTGEDSGEAVVDGVPVHRVRVPAAFQNTITSPPSLAALLRRPVGWSALARLWRKLRAAAQRELTAGADLLHAHGWIPAGLAAPSEVPLVLTVHGADGSLLTRSRIARRLATPLFQRVAVVTTVSSEVGAWVQSGAGRFVEPARVHPRPVDARGLAWTRGGGGVVTIAPLVPSSRVDLAIETVAMLASCGHDFPLTVVGDGPERQTLEERAVRLGVSSLVRFASAGALDNVRRHLERADMVLFTVRREAVAYAAVEALLAGVPVVACWDSGAAVDIVPESGAGRLTLPSAEALADSVLDLQNDADRLAMGRLVGESWRARLAPDRVAELCEGWYRNAIAR